MIELNQIYNQPAEDFLLSLPDSVIDLTVTSPPYDGLRKYNGFSFDLDCIVTQLFRTTKSGGVCVWVVGDQTLNGSESGSSFRQALRFMEAGWKLHDTMIYSKKNFIPQNQKRYEQAFEYMFVFVRGKIRTFNPIMLPCKTAGISQNFKRKGYDRLTTKEGSQRRRDEVLTVKDEKVHGNIFLYAATANRTGHPAPFPEKLAMDHINSWSNEGDLVCDIFSGSATTAKMALLLKRNFIGSEISQEYWELGNKRIDPILNPPVKIDLFNQGFTIPLK